MPLYTIGSSTAVTHQDHSGVSDGKQILWSRHSFEAIEQQVFGSSTIPSMSSCMEQALSMSKNLFETLGLDGATGGALMNRMYEDAYELIEKLSCLKNPTQEMHKENTDDLQEEPLEANNEPEPEEVVALAVEP
ncbi:non-specific phospholipase C6-like [Gossypium australe]|uniref:Non-specific phospholipase C6-like n=1 Tax=Gossypium australe TaxID=47621 RepID=A0A5B6X1Q5_9ROSI|nr:non-specific phospholipase C6-like [Gossypium australe]